MRYVKIVLESVFFGQYYRGVQLRNWSRSLSRNYWTRMRYIYEFLHQARQAMERIFADRKTTLYIVSMSVELLIKHCDDNEERLKKIDATLTTKPAREKL